MFLVKEPEVKQFSLKIREKDSKVTPKKPLTPKDFEAILKAAENAGGRVLMQVFFEARRGLA